MPVIYDLQTAWHKRKGKNEKEMRETGEKAAQSITFHK